MAELEDVVGDLWPDSRRDEPQPGRHLSMARLDQLDPRVAAATMHLDYGDGDRVFLVTVREVPRVPLPLDQALRVGDIDGVEVALDLPGGN